MPSVLLLVCFAAANVMRVAYQRLAKGSLRTEDLRTRLLLPMSCLVLQPQPTRACIATACSQPPELLALLCRGCHTEPC